MHCFAHVHRRRKPSAPGAFWTVLLMEQVAKATCILCKKLQRTRGGTWRFPRVSRAKSGILWLSGGTTRVRWRGASYLGPSMQLKACVRPRLRSHGFCTVFGCCYLFVWGYIADLSMVPRLRRGRLASRALRPPFCLYILRGQNGGR